MKAVKLEKTLCATAPDSLEKVLQHPGIWRAIDYKAAIACSAQTKAPCYQKKAGLRMKSLSFWPPVGAVVNCR